jgi:hypothetical protein
MAKPQIPLQTSLLQLGAKVNIFHDIYKKKPILPMKLYSMKEIEKILH